eukprot:gene22798-9217_t
MQEIFLGMYQCRKNQNLRPQQGIAIQVRISLMTETNFVAPFNEQNIRKDPMT